MGGIGTFKLAEQFPDYVAAVFAVQLDPDGIDRLKKIAALEGVWKVLVRDFFQRRIRPESTVVDIGAGACVFINEVRAKRRERRAR